jgi:hypothetical protein
MPTWSADGRHIAFVSDRNGRTFDLFVMEADGRNAVQITNQGTDVEFPAWSPLREPLADAVPLPTAVPTATPTATPPPAASATPAAGGGSICPLATDATYGYTAANPIKVGGGPFGGGPARQRAFLDALRGPAGQTLSYERVGSLPHGDTIVDIYRVTYSGLAQPIELYFDIYDEDPRQVPAGFTCATALP